MPADGDLLRAVSRGVKLDALALLLPVNTKPDVTIGVALLKAALAIDGTVMEAGLDLGVVVLLRGALAIDGTEMEAGLDRTCPMHAETRPDAALAAALAGTCGVPVGLRSCPAACNDVELP
mmetsp:Transcript_23479/g.36782  ORF Transcript_23479/g.36782 Transcript_23479/m.36782 type:complete len:121 (-) Transcript_23479:145-507(-)